MTKLYLEAIRHLPDGYVRDGTQVCEMTSPRLVVAIHPTLRPIMFAPQAGRRKKWKPLLLVPVPPPDAP